MRFNHVAFPFLDRFYFKPKKFGVVPLQINDFRLFFTDFQFEPVLQPQLYSNEYFFCITALPTEQLEIIRIADYMHFLEFGGIFESTINRSFIDRTVTDQELLEGIQEILR